MGNSRDISGEVYSEQIHFEIQNRSWAIGSCTPITIDGVEGYEFVQGEGNKSRDHLDTNFFSHELRGLNPNDRIALAQIMGEFGLLDCPFRIQSIPLIVDPDIFIERLRHGVNQTDVIRNKTIGSVSNSLRLGLTQYGQFVSHDEVVAVLSVFQEITKVLFDCLNKKKGNPAAPIHLTLDNARSSALAFLNTNATNEREITILIREETVFGELEYRKGTSQGYRLTNAISNQIISTVADSAAWYQCKAQNCDTWFKRKRGNKNARANSEYCSRTCSEKKKKMDYRNRINTTSDETP